MDKDKPVESVETAIQRLSSLKYDEISQYEGVVVRRSEEFHYIFTMRHGGKFYCKTERLKALLSFISKYRRLPEGKEDWL